jgi:two-component system chemotaxis response regulator CheY
MARVLVVDDAAFMRKMVTDALTGGGHEIVGEAGNGVEAVARYQELRPDVMTLDITMPEKDGIAALKEIIAIDPSAKVIMCSALGQESKVLESIKLGAKDFVVKPFKPARLPGGDTTARGLTTASTTRRTRHVRCVAGRPAARRVPAAAAVCGRGATGQFPVTRTIRKRASPASILS